MVSCWLPIYLCLRAPNPNVQPAVAQGLVAQGRILGGAFGLVASTIIMNNHIETFLKGHVSDEDLRKILVSPFSILDYGVGSAVLFRSSYIQAFNQDMRVSMYIAIVGFVSSLCIYQRNPPTVAERSELLAKAVQEYKDELRMRDRQGGLEEWINIGGKIE